MKKKYALVTGGNRGIGRAISEKLSENGYITIITYNKHRKEAVNTAKNIARKTKINPILLKMDVSNPESINKAKKKIEQKIPYLNVLVNNAGILHVGVIDSIKLEEWEKVFKVNVTGVFIVTKTFLPLLRKAKNASIINISSIAGQTGNVYASVAYSASKAAIIGFTKRLAIELAKEKIRVNAVAPSFVETNMVKDFMKTKEEKEKIKRLHPLEILLKPEDIAETVYFLAEHTTSRGITGQVISINAGRYT